MKNIFNVLALVILLPLPVYAASTQEPALSGPGGPVSPLCFTGLVEGDVFDPQSCPAAQGLVATDDPSYKPSEGFYGTAYRYEDQPDPLGMPFVEYRHLGEAGGSEAILVTENSGGSGVFSALYLLSHTDGGKLKVDSLVAAGDRCVGGIADAAVNAAGRLSYSANLTAQGLYNLATGQKEDTDTGLENCAVCCIGTANYKGGNLQSVTIDEQAIADLLPGENAATQCFNRLALSHREENASSLQPSALAKVVADFSQTCLPR